MQQRVQFLCSLKFFQKLQFSYAAPTLRLIVKRRCIVMRITIQRVCGFSMRGQLNQVSFVKTLHLRLAKEPMLTYAFQSASQPRRILRQSSTHLARKEGQDLEKEFTPQLIALSSPMPVQGSKHTATKKTTSLQQFNIVMLFLASSSRIS